MDLGEGEGEEEEEEDGGTFSFEGEEEGLSGITTLPFCPCPFPFFTIITGPFLGVGKASRLNFFDDGFCPRSPERSFFSSLREGEEDRQRRREGRAKDVSVLRSGVRRRIRSIEIQDFHPFYK